MLLLFVLLMLVGSLVGRYKYIFFYTQAYISYINIQEKIN